MIKIVVASESLPKIEGISQAFKKFYNDGHIRVKSVAIPSQVPEQPIGEEIFQGAENRLEGAKIQIDNNSYDYIVSCESGLLKLHKMYFNVQVVMIYSAHTKEITWGISDGLLVPLDDVKTIRNISLKKYFMEKFDGRDVINFSKGLSSREKLIEQATLIALAGWNLR